MLKNLHRNFCKFTQLEFFKSGQKYPLLHCCIFPHS